MGEHESKYSLDALLRRRSVRKFKKDEISLGHFSQILFRASSDIRKGENSKKSGDPYYILNSFYSWLQIFVVVQAVEGISRGVYQYDSLSHELIEIRKGVSDSDIATCVQHQYWIEGGGFCLFLAADWERYMWVYRHSRAYINLLIQAGEFGQEVLQVTEESGLRGWMTPAITESKATSLLELEAAREDAVYFLKIGLPDV